MKRKKYHNFPYFILLFVFFIISITSIYSFSDYLPKHLGNLVLKQTIFYIIGIITILILLKFDLNKLIKYSFHIYLINILLLILVLIIGKPLNGTKAWFIIPFIGTIQPSEFMKIGLVLYLAKIINNSKIKGVKNELFLILKVFIIVLIPAVLTFLEPDTGAVIVYFVGALVMLFVGKLRYRYFIIFFILISLIIGGILLLFFNKSDIFINIFGSSLFYRLDRLFDWTRTSGMQLENSILSIGSSGLIGHGINNIPIYYPEGQTDFIFTSLASTFGFIGMILLIITIVIFDLKIINDIKTNKTSINKYILGGFLAVFLYQQVQNIAMTIGLLPITGITLPFISYGGSSLISYMMILGIILMIKKENTT